jgi:hypothetical protein
MHLTEYGTLGQQAHALTKPVGAGLAAAGGIALAAWLRKRSA